MRLNEREDKMVRIPEFIKLKIKDMGYGECARLLNITRGYARFLASRRGTRIRQSHLDRIKEE